MPFSVILDTDLNLFSGNEVFTVFLMKVWFLVTENKRKSCLYLQRFLKVKV